MNDVKCHFIKTTNNEVASALSEQGFQEIPCSTQGLHIFINDKPIKFDNSVNWKLAQFTNMLSI